MEDQENKRSLFNRYISWLDVKFLFLRNKFKYHIASRFSASWIVVIVLVVGSWIIFKAHRCWFGNSVAPDQTAELFFGAGAVTGAMLAIAFAFSSQLVSRASEALPTRYFKLFARDTRIDLCYITIGIITISEFALGVMTTNQDGSANTSYIRLCMWLLLLTIALLYFSYVRLIQLLSHEYQVMWLSSRQKRQIDEISYLAKRMARASERGYKNLTAEEKLIVEAKMYEPLQNQIKALSENLDGIIELYFTYKNKGDDYAAHNYLHVASSMAMAYVLSRQNNALLKINPEAGLTPESSLSAFLQTSFEKLKIIWDKALAENDVQAIRKYLRDIQAIVRTSLFVDHVKYPNENPAFYTAYYNFRLLIKESIREKNIDALFEIASVIEQIAEIAITKKHSVDALDVILEDIQSICMITASDKDNMSAVNHNAIKNMLAICNRILLQNDIDDYRLSRMQEVVPICLALTILGPKNNLTDIAIMDFGDNIFARATYKADIPPTENQVHKVIQAARLSVSILQRLAVIANGKRYQTRALNHSIVDMVRTLTKILDEDLATGPQALDIRQVLNELARLPKAFPDLKESDRLSDIDDFIDRLTQAALTALYANEIEIATSIFDGIREYLHKILVAKRTSQIHDILHLINKIKVIGAAARKLRRQKFQQHVALQIRDLEKSYLTTYYPDGYEAEVLYSPSPTMLRQARNDNIFGSPSSGLPSYFHDAKAFFLERYSQDDLDSFEDYIWK